MEVRAYLVADAQTLELVQPRERALCHPTGLAQSGAVRGASTGNLGSDAALADQPAVLVEVVATVREQPSGPVQWTASESSDPGDGIEQGHQLGDIVPVATGQRHGERSAMPVDDHMVLGAGTRAVDRRRAGVSPPLRARTWEPSIEQSSISRSPALRSSTSRASWRRGHTPASVQSRSRRQQVTPLQPIRSAGTSAQVTPLRSTYTMPASATRSSTGFRPGKRRRRGDRAGSGGAIRPQSSSGTRSSAIRQALPDATAQFPAATPNSF